MPDPDAKPPRPTKRRLPILARHAISLGIVFVLALPLSYVGIRNYLQQQNLAQLDETDPATFEQGLAYVYANAGTNPDVMHAAVDRIKALPDDRAIELHRVLLIAYSDHEMEVDDHVTRAGAELMDRLPMPDAILVYRHTEAAGSGDESVMLDALDRQLQVEDDRQFLQLVDYYDSRAAWSRDTVPADAWLRWLVMLSHSNAELTQRLIARQLGELPEQANEPQIADALERLSSSPFASVRAQVLKSAAGYAAIAEDPTDYEQIIFTLGEDENQTIARRAWQIVGHLDPLSGFSPNWQDAPPYVAEAILWAAVKTNPDQVGPVMEAWQSERRIQSILAMHELEWENEAYTLLGDVLMRTPETDDEIVIFWRALPHLHRNGYMLSEFSRPEITNRLLDATVDEDTRQSKFSAVIAACCYYNSVGYFPDHADHPVAPYLLAFWEGYYHQGERYSEPVYLEKYDQWINGGRPPNDFDPFYVPGDNEDIAPKDRQNPFFDSSLYNFLMQPIATANWSDSQIRSITLEQLPDQSAHFMNLWLIINYVSTDTNIEETMRKQGQFGALAGSLLAGLRGERVTFIRGITADFLRNHPDITDDELHAMTDEQLAEFGLRRVDAVQALLDVAESNPDPVQRYETVSLLKLALWMRGDLGDDFTPEAEAMLLDPRLPTSTVLLALLHKQRPIALEYLFGDLIEPNPDLAELFIGERFWHVFRRFVKTDDLDLWLWGDPAAQDFQIEAMRQWYWVNRYLIDDCWIDD